MEVLDVLARCGGVADARTLVAFSSRRKLSAAFASGQVVRDGRGRYALPTADEARRAAHRLTALVSGLSAATAHGWEVKWPPIRPQLTVPAKRRVTESVLRAIALDVPGLDLRPQVAVSEAGWRGRPDLVDRERRIVVEAESFEFHGRRAALRHD